MPQIGDSVICWLRRLCKKEEDIILLSSQIDKYSLDFYTNLGLEEITLNP